MIVSNPNFLVLADLDPQIKQMLIALDAQDKDLAKETKTTDEIIAVAQKSLVQASEMFATASINVQKQLDQAQKSHCELEIAQEKELEALREKEGEIGRNMVSQQAELDGLRSRVGKLGSALNEISGACSRARTAIANYFAQHVPQGHRFIMDNYGNGYVCSPAKGIQFAWLYAPVYRFNGETTFKEVTCVHRAMLTLPPGLQNPNIDPPELANLGVHVRGIIERALL